MPYTIFLVPILMLGCLIVGILIICLFLGVILMFIPGFPDTKILGQKLFDITGSLLLEWVVIPFFFLLVIIVFLNITLGFCNFLLALIVLTFLGVCCGSFYEISIVKFSWMRRLNIIAISGMVIVSLITVYVLSQISNLKVTDIEGTYDLSPTSVFYLKNHLCFRSSPEEVPIPSIKINGDSTFSLINVPTGDCRFDFEVPAKKFFSADGNGLAIKQKGFFNTLIEGYSLQFPLSNHEEIGYSVTVLGVRPPYRLWISTGDPDDEQGLLLQQSF